MCWWRKHPAGMKTRWPGKNEYNITVNFPGDKSIVGQIVKVKITSAGESTLRGERVD